MKTKPFLCLVLGLAIFNGCHKDEVKPEGMKGSLSLNVGLFISINEEENSLKSTSGVEDFLVTIHNAMGLEIMVFQRASEIPVEIELDPGQYYVTAHSNNNVPAAFENPYYYGETPLFTISPGGQESVTVNCELANTMVTIVYSEQLRINYSDYSATVSTSAGSLTFTRDETRAGYFQPLPMTISVVLTWQKDDGSTATKTLTGGIPDPQPRKNYEIHIDAASADGSAFLQIFLDETVVSVEIVDINETTTPATGVYNSGDLLITEIMYDPAILGDSEGEWFEIYNNTDQAVDLDQVVIRKNGTESHIINAQVQLGAHEYYVLSRTEGAVIATNKYIYGSSISLNNTGANLALCNYGTDGTNGSVICSVDYSAEGFPGASGASICLSPALLNVTDAMSGDSWCVSVTAYNTGDLGTPGAENDPCL
jgi:hypothetical protein